MTIFRYFPPDRIDCLLNQEICFTPPLRFNDPFDLMPVSVPVTSRAYLKARAREAERDWRASFRAIPKADRKRLRLQWRKASIALVRANASQIALQIQSTLPAMLGFGVLCFSSVKDSLLMWAHYAQSHKGFVLEFDSENFALKTLGSLEKVTYDAKRPFYDPARGAEVSGLLYKTKSLEWQYENEFRIFRNLSACEKRTVGTSELFFAPLPLSCIRAVYLGSRVGSDVAERIKEAIKKSPAKILVYATTLDPYRFALRFAEI